MTNRNIIFRSIIGGILVALSFPPYHLPILMPVGLIIFFSVLDRLSLRMTVYSSLAFGISFFGSTVFWLLQVFGNAGISFIAILSLFPVLFGVTFRVARAKHQYIPTWILVAFIWCGVEYFRSEVFVLSFGWMDLGYAVVGSPLLAAGASVFGVYGLTFWIVAVAGIGMQPISNAPVRKLVWIGLGAIWIAGLFLPMSVPEANNPVSLRLVQAPSESDELFNLSSIPPSFPLDAIVWPEYAFVSDPIKDKSTFVKLQQLAAKMDVSLVFGGKDETGSDSYFNTAWIMSPKGQILGSHVKNHLVHFIKDGFKGHNATPIKTSFGTAGVAICFDMDYPDVARRLAIAGAEFFLVPNMDPDDWGPYQREQHRLMFQMRASETGRWLARSDVAGGTSVASSIGQQTASVNGSAPARLDVIIGRESGQNLYLRGGWRFGPACFILTILLAVLPRLKKSNITTDYLGVSTDAT